MARACASAKEADEGIEALTGTIVSDKGISELRIRRGARNYLEWCSDTSQCLRWKLEDGDLVLVEARGVLNGCIAKEGRLDVAVNLEDVETIFVAHRKISSFEGGFAKAILPRKFRSAIPDIGCFTNPDHWGALVATMNGCASDQSGQVEVAGLA